MNEETAEKEEKKKDFAITYEQIQITPLELLHSEKCNREQEKNIYISVGYTVILY